jgi:replicative DNA helicase
MHGVATGFNDLDTCCGGLRRGSVAMLAARPSMGKSTLAHNIALHVACESKLPVAIFSLSESAVFVIYRLLGSMAAIDLWRIRMGSIDDRDVPKYEQAKKIISESGIYVDDAPVRSIAEIHAECRRVVDRSIKLGLVLIDDLQAIDCVADGRKNQAVDWGATMNGLRSIAQSLDVPVLGLCGLSKALDGRDGDYRPRIGDLPDRVIATHADLLMFLYRDEIYDPDTTDAGIAELTVAYYRFGTAVTLKLDARELRSGRFRTFSGEPGGRNERGANELADV